MSHIPYKKRGWGNNWYKTESNWRKSQARRTDLRHAQRSIIFSVIVSVLQVFALCPHYFTILLFTLLLQHITSSVYCRCALLILTQYTATSFYFHGRDRGAGHVQCYSRFSSSCWWEQEEQRLLYWHWSDDRISLKFGKIQFRLASLVFCSPEYLSLWKFFFIISNKFWLLWQTHTKKADTNKDSKYLREKISF